MAPASGRRSWVAEAGGREGKVRKRAVEAPCHHHGTNKLHGGAGDLPDMMPEALTPSAAVQRLLPDLLGAGCVLSTPQKTWFPLPIHPPATFAVVVTTRLTDACIACVYLMRCDLPGVFRQGRTQSSLVLLLEHLLHTTTVGA